MSELEKKAALADLLLEHLATISSLRQENDNLLAENAHLRAELEALESLTGNTPPDDI